MAENIPHPELDNPPPGEQAYTPVERQIIYRSEEPIRAQLETGELAWAWIVDLVPSIDAPDEPWWGYAARDFTNPKETVGIMKLAKVPIDAALGFMVYTAGENTRAKERLQKVIENIRKLGNYQIDPASAIKLILAPTEGATQTAQEVEEEPAFTAEEAAEYVLNAVRNTPSLSERILAPAQPYRPPQRISYPRTTNR